MKNLFCGTNVRLRAVEKSDLPSIWKWQNDMEVMAHLWQRPVSLAELEREFEREIESPEGASRRFLIETQEEQPIGLIWYHN